MLNYSFNRKEELKKQKERLEKEIKIYKLNKIKNPNYVIVYTNDYVTSLPR